MSEPRWMPPVPRCECQWDLPRFSCCGCGAYEQSNRRADAEWKLVRSYDQASRTFGIGPLGDLLYGDLP